jgi:hypothetical protein
MLLFSSGGSRWQCPRSKLSAIWSAQNALSRSSIALKFPPSAPLCGRHIGPQMLSLHELFSWLASAWSRSRRAGRSRPRKPQSTLRHRSTSDTSWRGHVRQWIAWRRKKPPGSKCIVPAAPVSNWILQFQLLTTVQCLCHHDMTARNPVVLLTQTFPKFRF